MTEILEQVPSLQREKFNRELEEQVARLITPVEGAREAVVFLIAGIVGRVFSDKVTFGSSIATGKAVATHQHISESALLVRVLVDRIVLRADLGRLCRRRGKCTRGYHRGAAAGPVFELGINRLRARKILKDSVDAAHEKLNGGGRDAFDIAGKTAIYLQVLPDIVEIAKSTVSVFL